MSKEEHTGVTLVGVALYISFCNFELVLWEKLVESERGTTDDLACIAVAG